MRLSDYSFDKIAIGMPVVSAKGTPGKVIAKWTDKHDDWLEIQWDNGRLSADEHANLTKCTVEVAE